MKQKPRFFCDNCSQEVIESQKSCPSCGRIFISVRCPSCGHSGEEKMFSNGCPLCGYSKSPGAKSFSVKNRIKRPRRKKQKKLPAEPLPAWAYILTLLALLGVVVFLSHFLTR